MSCQVKQAAHVLHRSPSFNIKFCFLCYKIHYADRESKNIFFKNHMDMKKEQDSFEKKGRNRSIPVFSDAGSEWGEEYLELLLLFVFAEQFNLLIVH